MSMHFSKVSAPALMALLLLAGCGGGGGGGGNAGNGGSGNVPSLGNGPALTGNVVSPDIDDTQSETVNDSSRSLSSAVGWLPPTQNVDESAFTDLVGYKIYIGSEPGRFKIVRELKEPGLTEYLLEDLPAGKYYVGMTAVNSENIESPLSNVVVRVVGGS